MENTTKTYNPFVRLIDPFVGYTCTGKKPFIGLREPIVVSKGFTLIELIVTLVIAGILAALALPALNNFVSSNRLTTATNNLIADLQFARSEAIKRGAQVVICPSTDGSTCTGGTDLTGGWMIFRDLNNDEAWTSPGDERIRVQESAAAGTTIAGPASVAAIAYSRNGFLARGATPGEYVGAGEYLVCSTALKKGRAIHLEVTGRSSLIEKDC